MSGVARDQRHRVPQRPCGVCGGGENLPRGDGKRCTGYTSTDGEWCRCSREELAGALDQVDDLFRHKMHGACNCGSTHGADLRPSTNEPEAVYPYRDEQGVLLFEVVRMPGKRIRNRMPDGKGGHHWKLDAVRRVLYRLPELLAADPSTTVYVVEGEKDVDTLRRRGLVATTNPHGAGKWGTVSTLAAQVLAGRHVVVLADADKPGRAHARAVVESLRNVALSCVAQECAAPHKDVSDLLAAGLTLSDVVPLQGADPPVTGHAVSREDEEAAEPPADEGDAEIDPGSYWSDCTLTRILTDPPRYEIRLPSGVLLRVPKTRAFLDLAAFRVLYIDATGAYPPLPPKKQGAFLLETFRVLLATRGDDVAVSEDAGDYGLLLSDVRLALRSLPQSDDPADVERGAIYLAAELEPPQAWVSARHLLARVARASPSKVPVADFFSALRDVGLTSAGVRRSGGWSGTVWLVPAALVPSVSAPTVLALPPTSAAAPEQHAFADLLG